MRHAFAEQPPLYGQNFMQPQQKKTNTDPCVKNASATGYITQMKGAKGRN